MRAVQITAYDGKPESLSVVDLPMPRPGPGEVLVQVFASPVNPSDLMFLQGLYGFKKPLPAVPGFEGSGTVVDAGPGMLGSLLKGKRVACAAADQRITGGMWAEYLVTSAKLCIPLRKDVDLEQGAVMLVNPMTAWGLMEEARRGRHKALVQTAAASALGRMIVRLGQRLSMPVINIVRRPEQVALLRSLGAEYVLSSEEADFEARLRDLCHRLRATIGFDAVAGELSLKVLRAQPPGAHLLVYGALSLTPCQADPASLIFENKRIEGFWLTGWLGGKSLLGQLRVARQVQNLLSSDLKTEFQARIPLNDAPRGLRQYATNMTAGKVLLLAAASAGRDHQEKVS
jgi:NADPH:quinone reductase-like Zn-dependent oxidoreductase